MDFKSDERFDAVLISSAYYYLEDVERRRLLKKILRELLTENGYLLISFGDLNFTKFNIKIDKVLKEIARYYDIINVIKSYEYIPMYEIDETLHSALDHWFTSVLAKPKQ